LVFEVAVKRAQIVQTGNPQRNLLDQWGTVVLCTARHQGDLVIDRLRIAAQEHHASFGILFGDLHTQEIAVKGGHALDVAYENAQMTESGYTWHGSLSTPPAVVQISVSLLDGNS